jgi:hypothetical protein
MDFPSDRIWGEVGAHLRSILLGQTVTRFPNLFIAKSRVRLLNQNYRGNQSQGRLNQLFFRA